MSRSEDVNFLLDHLYCINLSKAVFTRKYSGEPDSSVPQNAYGCYVYCLKTSMKACIFKLMRINDESMKKWASLNAVEKDPNKVSGNWIFRGTRVPVSALFENLRDGASMEEFLEWFPGVNRSQIEAILNHEAELLNDTKS